MLNEGGIRFASEIRLPPPKNAEYPDLDLSSVLLVPISLGLLLVWGISPILARAESPLMGRLPPIFEITLDGGRMLSRSPLTLIPDVGSGILIEAAEGIASWVGSCLTFL